MVVALGPGKFYGGSLPRPRFYTDMKLNESRVDPPLPVMEAFLSWAADAHWSMGGLSFKRCRLQGRIEGNIQKLRSQQDREEKRKTRKGDPSPAPPPSTTFRHVALIDELEDERNGDVLKRSQNLSRKKRARRLFEEFDNVDSFPSGGGDVGKSLQPKKVKGKDTKVSKKLPNREADVGSDSSPVMAERTIASRTRGRRLDAANSPPVDMKKGLNSKPKSGKASFEISPERRRSPRTPVSK